MLTSIQLRNCLKLTNESMKELSKCNQLIVVHINSNDKITDEGIEVFLIKVFS